MKNNSLGIVFIHGSGLGSFVWDVVMAKIGMPVLAVEYPNRISDGNYNKDLRLKDYVNPIVQEVKKWEQQRIIIVAHSFGGIVGLKVAEEIMNQQLAGFLAISANIPANGESFVTSLPFPKNIFTNIMIRVGGTKPPKSAIIKGLCNDLTTAQTQKIVDSFVPESRSIFFESINYKLPEVKRMYVKLLKDNNLSPEYQEKMALNLKADKIISLNSGHLAMLSVPDLVTNAIREFVREIDKDYFNPTHTDFSLKGKKQKVKS